MSVFTSHRYKLLHNTVKYLYILIFTHLTLTNKIKKTKVETESLINIVK